MSSKPSVPPISSLIRVEAASHQTTRGSTDPTGPKPVAKTPWVALSTISYRFDHDKPNTYPRKWDIAERTTRPVESAADAVVMLARLRLADNVTRIVLVKQFRPPMNAVSVELPAGLLEPGESPEQAALRELREETGFTGTVRCVHPPASLTPGMSNELVILVEVDVEGVGGKQQLDASENIEVISVPLHRLDEALQYVVDTEGVIVMHAVSALAVGLRLGMATKTLQ